MKPPLWSAGRATALWSALAAVFVLSCAFLFAGEPPLQTNLMTLLPPTERNPVAERAVGTLADAVGNRAVFLLGNRDPAVAKNAAHRFAASLQDGGGFARVQLEAGPVDPRRIIDFFAPYPFSLLSEPDRAALARGTDGLESRLRQKLYSPIRSGLSAAPALDPFGLVDAWLAELPFGNFRVVAEDGLLIARAPASTYVLVSAELSGSAYDHATQEKTLAGVTKAEAALRLETPDVEVLRTGTVFFAQAARESAAREMDMIGIGSLVGVIALMLWVFRSPRPLLLGLLSVGIGISAAITATVLVFGASLIGEAIDYSIQYFSARLGAGARWEARAGLNRILPGLSVALATSALGYVSLLLVPFPALRQIGFFALVGLAAAFISVVLLLPALPRKASRRDVDSVIAVPRRMLAWWRRHMTRRACLALMAVLLLAAIPGLLRLHGDDDIRLLINRPPALVAQEQQIRALTGVGNSSQFFLVEGATPEQVLDNEQRLVQRLRALVARDDLSGFQALSSFVPSAARQRENRALWRRAAFGDPAKLRALLAREGLREEVIDASPLLLSAATTLLSFGLLALSSMPALHNFGLSLLVGIGIAVLLAPMVLSFRRDAVCAG